MERIAVMLYEFGNIVKGYDELQRYLGNGYEVERVDTLKGDITRFIYILARYER